jgi:hypothetical protein
MPWYLVERTFTFEDNRSLPGPADSQAVHLSFDQKNAHAGVTWVHSYVTPDKKKSFCLYQAPNPEAVRQAASLNGLPVDRINEVHLQEPFASREGE